MTGGQFSPLSGPGVSATTAPYKTIDPDFDTVKLALGAGASFVARSTTFHVKELIGILKKAIQHKGFSLVEVLSQCPTYFGRRNKMGNAVEMMQWFRDNTAKIGSKKLEENPGYLPRGIFAEADTPEYCAEYARMMASAREGRI
jgi:2-oxoglutarate ferredoxin oxidoreductase subunit beta